MPMYNVHENIFLSNLFVCFFKLDSRAHWLLFYEKELCEGSFKQVYFLCCTGKKITACGFGM